MIAIIVIKRKPVPTVHIALRIKMWIAIKMECMDANIKLITLKEKLKNIVAPANGTQNLKVFVATVIQSIEPIFGV